MLPEHQGCGVGDTLLQLAKAAFPSLQLWTFQKNVLTRRFYEKRGFVAIQETNGLDNEEHEPDVLYRWQTRQLVVQARNCDFGISLSPLNLTSIQ